MKNVNDRRRKSGGFGIHRMLACPAIAAVFVALAAAGCAVGGEIPTGKSAFEVTSAEGTQEYRGVQASDLKPYLPGCFEALRDPGTQMDGETELRYVEENPELAVLMAGGRQLCVDEIASLEHWVATGDWPQPQDWADAPAPREPTSAPMEGTVLVNGQPLPTRTPRIAPSARQLVGNGSVAGPLDDSNPLPPHPAPIR